MDILVYIFLGLLTLRLFVSLTNLSFRPYLPTVRRLKDVPTLSLLINGDNDEVKMWHILELLKRVHYPHLEIILGIYNPQGVSLDAIRKVASEDKRVRIIDIPKLQRGWSQELQMSSILGGAAHGNYLLFMDPDIELRGGILEILVSYMQKHKLGLMSIFPSYDVHTRAEWSTFPILNQLYLSLFLLRRMRMSKRPKASLANRRFMLFEGAVYRQFMPFEEVKNCKEGAKDIAEYLKGESIAIDWRIGDHRVRMLGTVSWRRCVQSVGQELMNFFGHYYMLGVLYGMFMLWWWLPFVIAQAWWLLLVGIAETLITQVILARITKVSVGKNIIYFFPQMVMLLVILWISVHHQMHKRRWRRRCGRCQA